MDRSGSHTLRGLRLVAFGAAFIGLGVLAGRVWGAGEPERVWHEARPAASSPPSFADIVAQVQPGVVSVQARVPLATEREDGAGSASASGNGVDAAAAESEAGLRNGSGFVVDEGGLVVTSRHVVAGAKSVEVFVPGQPGCPAFVVGEDFASDLALLRLLSPPPELRALPIGRSEELRAGDWIVAVGNPYGFQQTVTAGIVSFVGRHLPHSDLKMTSDFLQISAPVNPGSSGGPVLALDGSVVGLTTRAAVEAQGISFAVPSRTLKWVLAAMTRSLDGRVRRGYLGIEFDSWSGLAEGAPCGGARVLRVVDGAPAETAGLHSGDIVVAVNGEAVGDAAGLHERIVTGSPGQQLAMQVLRGGHVRDSIDAVLGEMRAQGTLPVN